MNEKTKRNVTRAKQNNNKKTKQKNNGICFVIVPLIEILTNRVQNNIQYQNPASHYGFLLFKTEFQFQNGNVRKTERKQKNNNFITHRDLRLNLQCQSY